MSSLDPSSSLLVLVSPRGPKEHQERVHRTCSPGGTCYAFRVIYLLETCIDTWDRRDGLRTCTGQRWEFGACPKPSKVEIWVAPCQPASGRERHKLAQLLGQQFQGLHPIIIYNYEMPPPSHPSGVLVAPSMHERDCAPPTTP